MKSYTEIELRELDQWIYRNVPGLKTCNCVNWMQPKFGQKEYSGILQTFLAQGSKDPWPEIEPDLLCGHQEEYSTNPAAAFQLLEKCAEKLQSFDVCIWKGVTGGLFFCGERKGAIDVTNFVKATTLPLAIALFAKQIHGK